MADEEALRARLRRALTGRIRTRDPHLGKVMEFVRMDCWNPLSTLSSVGASAQSVESAPVRSRSFNALNTSTNSSPRSSGAGRARATLAIERSDIRHAVADVAGHRHLSEYGTYRVPRGWRSERYQRRIIGHTLRALRPLCRARIDRVPERDYERFPVVVEPALGRSKVPMGSESNSVAAPTSPAGELSLLADAIHRPVGRTDAELRARCFGS